MPVDAKFSLQFNYIRDLTVTDSQFEALLAAIQNLANRIDSLSNSVAETANLLHDDLQDVVSSIDRHSDDLEELAENITGKDL